MLPKKRATFILISNAARNIILFLESF